MNTSNITIAVNTYKNSTSTVHDTFKRYRKYGAIECRRGRNLGSCESCRSWWYRRWRWGRCWSRLWTPRVCWRRTPRRTPPGLCSRQRYARKWTCSPRSDSVIWEGVLIMYLYLIQWCGRVDYVLVSDSVMGGGEGWLCTCIWFSDVGGGYWLCTCIWFSDVGGECIDYILLSDSVRWEGSVLIMYSYLIQWGGRGVCWLCTLIWFSEVGGECVDYVLVSDSVMWEGSVDYVLVSDSVMCEESVLIMYLYLIQWCGRVDYVLVSDSVNISFTVFEFNDSAIV